MFIKLYNLQDKIIKGLSWSSSAQFFKQVIQFSVLVILAHLLTPKDFGLFSMIAVFTGFAELFNDIGLGAAIIQRSDLNNRHLNSVFWANLIIGISLTLITIFAAPNLSYFYNEPLLTTLTICLSVNFIINSLCIVQTSILQKQMYFRKLFCFEMIATILSSAISLLMAFSGYGVWSLVSQSIAYSLFYALSIWVFSTWRPKVLFDWNSLKELLGFGTNLFGFNVFNYWVRNMDKLLIGKSIGSSALGLYTRAYSLMLFPVSQISSILGRVMFPALSIIQKDINMTKKVYLSSTRIISLFAFPFMTVLFITAEPLILIIYGEKWKEATPIFQMLCIAGIGQTVGTTVGWIYTSQGRTDVMFRWGILSGIIYIISFFVGINWGAFGVASAYVITGYLILWYPAWAIPGKLINISFWKMLTNLSGTFFCTILMGIAMFVLKHFQNPQSSPLNQITVQFVFGTAVYYILIKSFRIQAYKDICSFLEKQKNIFKYF